MCTDVTLYCTYTRRAIEGGCGATEKQDKSKLIGHSVEAERGRLCERIITAAFDANSSSNHRSRRLLLNSSETRNRSLQLAARIALARFVTYFVVCLVLI